MTRIRVRWKPLLRFVFVVAAVWLVVALGLGAAVYLNENNDQARPADVIIVLGAGLRRNAEPGPALIRRAAQGAQLWHDGYAPVIICAGGYPMRLPRSEADACRELLVNDGVPADAILLEDRSRSTEENAYYSREIMEANGWQDAIVVSDGYHLLRAGWIFQQAGLTVYPSPAAGDPPMSNHVSSIAREVVALHWQLFKTILGLPYTYVPWL